MLAENLSLTEMKLQENALSSKHEYFL